MPLHLPLCPHGDLLCRITLAPMGLASVRKPLPIGYGAPEGRSSPAALLFISYCNDLSHGRSGNNCILTALCRRLRRLRLPQGSAPSGQFLCLQLSHVPCRRPRLAHLPCGPASPCSTAQSATTTLPKWPSPARHPGTASRCPLVATPRRTTQSSTAPTPANSRSSCPLLSPPVQPRPHAHQQPPRLVAHGPSPQLSFVSQLRLACCLRCVENLLELPFSS